MSVFVRALRSRVYIHRPFNTASCGVLPLSHSPFCQSVYLSLSPEAVAQALQPRISLLPGHEHLLCVPPRPRLNHPFMYCADEDSSDMRGNFTAHCNATVGTVVWLIGGYAMVDRDQFSQQVYGVLVEDSGSNRSRFALYPCGADFLIGQFDGSFNITCKNMVNKVNLYRSSDHLYFHEGCECVCVC